MNYCVKTIAEDDQEVLWEFLYLAIHVPEGKAPYPRSILYKPVISCYVENWGREGDEGLIAWQQDQPIGACWARLWPGKQKGFGYIDSRIPELAMSVIPGARGKGIGSSLLKMFLLNLADKADAVSLSVDEDNAACRLYKRLGFVSLKKVGDSLTMIKELKKI